MSSVQKVFAEAQTRLAATVVIVLYRVDPMESPAFQSVMEAGKRLDPKAPRLNVLLWDNSPEPQLQLNLPDGVRYVSDPRNSGLATAYNQALDHAIQEGSDWLITLDQDTTLPSDYFARMAAAAQHSSSYAGVGAIVPQIEADGKSVSPNRFLFGALPWWYRRGYCGVPDEAVFAFNSGSMLSVAALEQVGGYDPWFWLDDSDAQIFNRLHRFGKRVYIAGDIQVQHNFSMKNIGARMSPARYQNALLAETAFWDLNMNWLAGWERTLRLVLRLIKHRRRKDGPELQRITRKAILRRLFLSKKKRIEEWRQQTRERLGSALDSPSKNKGRLKVSACMAAYNGGNFVDTQLGSILSQLHEDDEIVIVDDCSRDDTVDRIARFNDRRIRLMRHMQNAGVVPTFEDALRCAKGDVLFLCDDDDIWAPTKVQRFIELFESRPDVEIVTSRVGLIDEQGGRLSNSRVNRGGIFRTGFWRNVMMNHYQGSAMALRASLLGRVLPFPRHKSFLHDAWIGTRNEIAGGKAEFIDEDLLFYRRHSSNTTRTKTILNQIRTRFDLLVAHISYAIRV